MSEASLAQKLRKNYIEILHLENRKLYTKQNLLIISLPVPPKGPQRTLTSHGHLLEAAPSVQTWAQRYIPQEEKMRSLLFLGSSWRVNQGSRPP